MGCSKDVKEFIVKNGLTNLAAQLSDSTGEKFSAQQINHWKTRGVPYRWLDIVAKISCLPKEKLRANSPSD
jgi:hypothetical protein